MSTLVRPLFYQDVANEVAWLAANAGPDIAVRWAESVWNTVSALELQPHLARARADLPFPGVRSWRVNDFGRWLIFYGVRETVLILYRVRHGAMNLLKLDYNS